MKNKEKDTKVELKTTKKEMKPIDRPELRSPFTLMRHIAEDMENMMADRWFDRVWPDNAMFRRAFPEMERFDWRPFRFEGIERFKDFSPAVEMFERDGELIVRADLPGMNKENIKVEVHDNRLMIEGERKNEFEEEKEGWYHSERSYGKFRRELPLPEAVKTEEAKAVFKDGVLEISMAAPKLALKGKQLEIKEESVAPKTAKATG